MDYIKTLNIMDIIKIAGIILAYSPIIYTMYQIRKFVKIGKKTLYNSMKGENPEADRYKDYLENFINKKPDDQIITWALLKRNIDLYKWAVPIGIPGSGLVSTIGVIWTDYINSSAFLLVLVLVFFLGSILGFALKKIDMDVAKYYIIKDYRKSNKGNEKTDEIEEKNNESSKVNKDQ